MAGIGFELRKLFTGGTLASLRAYGYATLVCTGPMLLGVILLFSVRFIAIWGGALRHEQDLLVAMISYSMLASLFFNNMISIVSTRYAADMLYSKKLDRIMPALFGSLALLLGIGGIFYGLFLFFSGVSWHYKLLSFVLFCELTTVWMQMSFITMVKDYQKIMLIFCGGIASVVLAGFLLIALSAEAIGALLFSVCVGYGVMLTAYFLVLQSYFPAGKGDAWEFLPWIERYPSLVGIGILTSLGLFLHLIIIWFSPMGWRVEGLFYHAPSYDVPVLLAFLTSLATTVNLVTSVEVNFYPKYKYYFDLFRTGGTMRDIMIAERDMLTVLRQELVYMALKQFIVTVLSIVLGSSLLPELGMGFNASVLGTFRILCIGYGIYAIGNGIMLILLYFSDYKGAVVSSIFFATFAIVGTLIFLKTSIVYYGFGFALGAMMIYAVAALRLWQYTHKLQFRILASQHIFERRQGTAFLELSHKILRFIEGKMEEKPKFHE